MDDASLFDNSGRIVINPNGDNIFHHPQEFQYSHKRKFGSKKWQFVDCEPIINTLELIEEFTKGTQPHIKVKCKWNVAWPKRGTLRMENERDTIYWEYKYNVNTIAYLKVFKSLAYTETFKFGSDHSRHEMLTIQDSKLVASQARREFRLNQEIAANTHVTQVQLSEIWENVWPKTGTLKIGEHENVAWTLDTDVGTTLYTKDDTAGGDSTTTLNLITGLVFQSALGTEDSVIIETPLEEHNPVEGGINHAAWTWWWSEVSTPEPKPLHDIPANAIIIPEFSNRTDIFLHEMLKMGFTGIKSTLELLDATDFPSEGVVTVGNATSFETFSYAGKAGNTLLNVARSRFDTVNKQHAKGEDVQVRFRSVQIRSEETKDSSNRVHPSLGDLYVPCQIRTGDMAICHEHADVELNVSTAVQSVESNDDDTTTITVEDTTGFPETGTLRDIDGNLFEYLSKTPNSFTLKPISIYVTLNSDPFASPYYRFYSDASTSQEIVPVLEQGVEYTFTYISSGHPFYISSGYKQAPASGLTLGGDGSTTTGLGQNESLTLQFDASFSGQLLYYCVSHLNMQGTIDYKSSSRVFLHTTAVGISPDIGLQEDVPFNFDGHYVIAKTSGSAELAAPILRHDAPGLQNTSVVPIDMLLTGTLTDNTAFLASTIQSQLQMRMKGTLLLNGTYRSHVQTLAKTTATKTTEKKKL